MLPHLTEGPGRYAYPSIFNGIDKFFTSPLPNGVYTGDEIVSMLGLSFSAATPGSGDLAAQLFQYGTDISNSDHPGRSYVFGSEQYRAVVSNATFEVNDSNRIIRNLEIRVFDDNFDYVGGLPIIGPFVETVLASQFDPYNLIPKGVEVPINYSPPGLVINTYTTSNYLVDSLLEDAVAHVSPPRDLLPSLAAFGQVAAGVGALAFNFSTTTAAYRDNIFDSSRFLSYTRGDQRVVYGSNGSDILDPDINSSLIRGGSAASRRLNSFLIAGGAGNDTLSGGRFFDELQGGDGDDVLNGRRGDDFLFGGSGNDTLNGRTSTLRNSTGFDVADYRGNRSQYRIELANTTNGDLIFVTDSIAPRDGSDVLRDIDRLRFSDRVINTNAVDLVFVVDTTGSMADDIAAVQASATALISQLFENAINARIAVVGYNDPDTTTLLSFTEQPEVEERIDAAVAAINSLTAEGGGDFPEAVNAGLLRALSGGAGTWRTTSDASRNIILFGDAPPNDNQLRPLVLQLAANLGISEPEFSPFSISPEFKTSKLTDSLALTSFEITTQQAEDDDEGPTTFPVQIFTVLIGSDSETAEDFASLATETGGRSFTAADATEVVSVLLDVIAAISSPNSVTLSLSEATFSENLGTTTVTATLSDAALEDVTINLAFSGTAINGLDFIPSATSIVIPAGNTSGNISIRGVNDFFFEGDETINVDIAGGTNLRRDAPVTITITDDEPPLPSTGGTRRTLGSGTSITGTNASELLQGTTDRDTIVGFGGNDFIFGEGGNDSIDGGTGDDFIFGGDGNDTLLGSFGNDTIVGGLGADVLTGGSGRDVFVLNSISDRGDRISDFVSGVDLLLVSQTIAQSFSDLTISRSSGSTTISIGANTLVTLTNFSPTNLISTDIQFF